MSKAENKGMDPVPVQIERFKTNLKGRRLSLEDPLFAITARFLRSGIRFSEEDKQQFMTLLCETFSLTNEQLLKALFLTGKPQSKLNGLSHDLEAKETHLFSLLPPGFFQDYTLYNAQTEVPMSYNVFCSLVLVGAALGRRAWFEMGPFRLYPPQGIGLMGPSGVKKTTAGDIALMVLVSAGLCAVYSEKITPEALVEAMNQLGTQGLIYAPEAAVLMGKQKYNEGLIPLVTRLMDCPSYISTGTISRGVTELREVACSVIFCSTPDWFSKNVPEDVFGGGFIPRFMLVHQPYSLREIAIPKVNSLTALVDFGKYLQTLKTQVKGEMKFTPLAQLAFESWYSQNKIESRRVSYEASKAYFQRKPNHIIRTALALHIASCATNQICEECLERTIQLLAWNEAWLPSLYQELFRSPHGADQAFVLEQVQGEGGVISHTMLMRRVQHKMSSAQLQTVLTSLREAQQVEEVSNSLLRAWRTI